MPGIALKSALSQLLMNKYDGPVTMINCVGRTSP